MSVSILPIRLGQLVAWPARKERPAPKHSAPAEVDRLRRSLTFADLLIKTQRVQLNDADRKVDDANERRDNAEKALRQAEATIRLRDHTITELRRKLDVGVKAEHVIAKTQELSVEEIQRHCVMPLHQSPLADPAHVPAWVRH